MVTTSVLQRQLRVLEQKCLPLPVAHLFPFLHFSRPILFNSKEKEKNVLSIFLFRTFQLPAAQTLLPTMVDFVLKQVFLASRSFPTEGKDGKEWPRGSGFSLYCYQYCYFTRDEYLMDRTSLQECNSSKYRERQELSELL